MISDHIIYKKQFRGKGSNTQCVCVCVAALVGASVACAQLAVEASDGTGRSSGSAADAGGQPPLEQTVSVRRQCSVWLCVKQGWAIWPKKLSKIFHINNY